MLDMKGAVAVITGGGSGIGESIAKYWVQNGGKVVLGDIMPEGLDRVAGDIKEMGGEVATLKVDGLFFAIGVLTGIFIFGETVDNFSLFWNSSYMGRFTLPELFGLPTGWVVLGVVLMALFMFWGSEQLIL